LFFNESDEKNYHLTLSSCYMHPFLRAIVIMHFYKLKGFILNM